MRLGKWLFAENWMRWQPVQILHLFEKEQVADCNQLTKEALWDSKGGNKMRKMPDQVGHDGKGQDQAQDIIKIIDNCKDQNQLHGFFAEALGVSVLRLYLSQRIVIRCFVSCWKSTRSLIIRVK